MAAKHTKLVRGGPYVAEVEVELIESDQPWGPYLSTADAQKLDEVRSALNNGDVASALKAAQVYRLTPISAT